jgi:hypothetical protein
MIPYLTRRDRDATCAHGVHELSDVSAAVGTQNMGGLVAAYIIVACLSGQVAG